MDSIRAEIKEILSTLEERGRIKELIRNHPEVNVNIVIINIPFPPLPTNSKMAVLREKETYFKMEKELINNYRGKFVAVLNGEIVGVGEDKMELALGIYKERGYVPMYIGQVGAKERVIRVPSPRIRQR